MQMYKLAKYHNNIQSEFNDNEVIQCVSPVLYNTVVQL